MRKDLLENFINDYDKDNSDEGSGWKVINVVLIVFVIIIIYTVSRNP